MTQETSLRVATSSEPKKVAGAIANIVRSGSPAIVTAVGAAAINQTVKSIAVARMYVGDDGIDLVTRVQFTRLELDGKEKTAITFAITSM